MNRKNIVRINVTAPAIVGLETNILGYERVIAPHQSISVNIGRLKFREFTSLDKLANYDIENNRSTGGLSLAIDYRRYLKKRNRGFAPDGLYYGPFITYYQYKHHVGLEYTDPTNLSNTHFDFDLNFQALHLGIELGYQFIIKKRLAIDLIFIGPSWGKYKANFKLDGNLNVDEQSALYQAFSELLQERVPGLANLIEDRELIKTGNFSSNSFGMRYLIQIGYLF